MMQNPEKFQPFQTSMVSIDVTIIVNYFDFSTLKDRPTYTENGTIELVDVGGGEGTVFNKTIEAHSKLAPKH
ncbi:hypothetical protein ACHAPU_008606 [Fusarium lateritium]